MPAKRVLLLFPHLNTLGRSFAQGFETIECQTMTYSFGENIGNWQKKIHSHIGKLPYSIRSKWYGSFARRINESQLDVFRRFTPDFVMVYNSMMLFPETVREMKRNSRVIFFMADSPFYTPHNDYYLPCLAEADLILCPDSYWEKQFRGMGLENARFFLLGANPEVNHPRQVTAEEREKWGSDLVFIGATYLTAAGYKRALFLNQFAGLDIKIYTNGAFRRWYPDFPGLQSKVVPKDRRYSDEEVNTIMNCCKIYPVDANPGIINGAHLRIFECVGSGILPLAEYRKDVKKLFGGLGLPIIESYAKAASLAEYYLRREDERRDLVNALRSEFERSYSPNAAAQAILDMAGL